MTCMPFLEFGIFCCMGTHGGGDLFCCCCFCSVGCAPNASMEKKRKCKPRSSTALCCGLQQPYYIAHATASPFAASKLIKMQIKIEGPFLKSKANLPRMHALANLLEVLKIVLVLKTPSRTNIARCFSDVHAQMYKHVELGLQRITWDVPQQERGCAQCIVAMQGNVCC